MADPNPVDLKVSVSGADEGAASMNNLAGATTNVVAAGKASQQAAAQQAKAAEKAAAATAAQAATEGTAAKASKDLGKIKIELAEHLKKQVKATKEVKEQTTSANKAMADISSAANGGAQGVFSLKAAVNGLTAAFKANPILAAISLFLLLKDAASSLGNVLGSLIVNARTMGEEMGYLGTRSASAASALDEIRKSGDKALEKVGKDAADAADNFERLAAGIDETQSRYLRFIEAERKAAAAKLDQEEATALAGAKTEEERASVSASFGARRRALDTAATAAQFDVRQRTGEEKRDAAITTAQESQQKIDSTQSRYDTTRRALDEQLERNKTLKAGSTEADSALGVTARLRAELAALGDQLKKVREEEGQNIERAKKEQRSAESDLRVLDVERKAAGYSQGAAATTAQTTDAAALQKAREADAAAAQKAAREATLANIGTQAGELDAGAKKLVGTNLGRNQSVFDAAKKLHEAATAAQEDGTTQGEAEALEKAVQLVLDTLAEQKAESKALKAAQRMIIDQIKSLRTT